MVLCGTTWWRQASGCTEGEIKLMVLCGTTWWRQAFGRVSGCARLNKWFYPVKWPLHVNCVKVAGWLRPVTVFVT